MSARAPPARKRTITSSRGRAGRYCRQDDGTWFPVSLGSEFRIRALFFFNRTMTISLENKAFEHTHVQTKIVGADQ